MGKESFKPFMLSVHSFDQKDPDHIKFKLQGTLTKGNGPV